MNSYFRYKKTKNPLLSESTDSLKTRSSPVPWRIFIASIALQTQHWAQTIECLSYSNSDVDNIRTQGFSQYFRAIADRALSHRFYVEFSAAPNKLNKLLYLLFFVRIPRLPLFTLPRSPFFLRRPSSYSSNL